MRVAEANGQGEPRRQVARASKKGAAAVEVAPHHEMATYVSRAWATLASTACQLPAAGWRNRLALRYQGLSERSSIQRQSGANSGKIPTGRLSAGQMRYRGIDSDHQVQMHHQGGGIGKIVDLRVKPAQAQDRQAPPPRQCAAPFAGRSIRMRNPRRRLPGRPLHRDRSTGWRRGGGPDFPTKPSRYAASRARRPWSGQAPNPLSALA